LPRRTKEEQEAIKSLQIKSADKYCNARKVRDENGSPLASYCKKIAGWGTNHPGTGRCRNHGGSSQGAPIVHGLYSKKVRRTISEEIARISSSPNFLNLYEELALCKAAFSDLLGKLGEKMGTDGNFWISQKQNAYGSEDVISPEASLLMKMMETMGKSYERIIASETKVQNTLSVRSVYLILEQIKENINSNCGSCPVRGKLKKGLSSIKISREE
jgi:hypothetical protein